MEDSANREGEIMLASAVLATIIEDLTLSEGLIKGECRLSDYKKSEIDRNASEACYSLYSDNDLMRVWFTIVDVPRRVFKKYIKEKYPLSYTKYGKIHDRRG